jgi:hypothetical protein
MRRDERQPAPTNEIVDEPRIVAEPTSVPAAPPAVARDPGAIAPAAAREPHDLLFPSEESVGYRSRWEAIQTGFVDEPRAAVEQADALVSQVVARLSEVFGRERETLEQQWGRGDNVSTEDLRIALKRYRTFFDRLLSV